MVRSCVPIFLSRSAIMTVGDSSGAWRFKHSNVQMFKDSKIQNVQTFKHSNIQNIQTFQINPNIRKHLYEKAVSFPFSEGSEGRDATTDCV
jgi:hypothetical protein